MGWRTVVVDSQCKLTYKCGFLVIKKENTVAVHISEIDVLVLSTPQLCFSGVAIAELLKAKVKLIFCDERRDPIGELASYYDNYHSSKNILEQTRWSEDSKRKAFTVIIRQKILNQARLLIKLKKQEAELLLNYANEIKEDDETNREGHAAKVYFNALFGNDFERRKDSPVNAALNYGYSLIMSYINREIVANGNITQIGIHHCNEFNQFNLSCDLMEPFRVLIDEAVYSDPPTEFDKTYKVKLLKVLSMTVNYDEESTLVTNAISKYVRSVISALSKNDIESIKLYEF